MGINTNININKYECIKSSQYIPLPTPIQDKSMDVSMLQNSDCFKWTIISAMYSINIHSNRTTSYKINNISDDIITLDNGIVLTF